MNFKYIKSMLHALRYGVFSKFWPYLSHGVIWILGPRFAAFLSARTIDWGPQQEGPIVLCLFRESFVKDIHEMRKRTDMQFAVVMGGFTRFQEVWFPKMMQIQTFYQSYQGPGREYALMRSEQYAQHLINYVERKRPVQAVLSANFDYWQEVGLKEVCKKMGIPFFVLSREHPVVPSVCEIVTEWYKRSAYKFEGAQIAVAGDSSKEVLARIGTVCNDNQVVVTGLPRFDAWRDVDCSLPLEERNFITLLTFTDGYFANETFKSVLKAFLQAAKNKSEPSLRFMIKTKDAHDQQLVKNLIPVNYLDFVECTHEVDLFKILPISRYVIGYNSLSMVESVIAGCKIVIPAWDECKDRGSMVMYSADDPIVSRIVEFAYSSDDFMAMLVRKFEGENRLNTKIEVSSFLNKYIYIPSGATSSQLVVEMIQQYNN